MPLVGLGARTGLRSSDTGQDLGLAQIDDIDFTATLLTPEAGAPSAADHQDPVGLDGDLYLSRVRLPEPVPKASILC